VPDTTPNASGAGQTEAQSEEWLALLTRGHAPLVRMRHLLRLLPSAPRCKVCNNPFGGIGGRLVGLAGFKPSRKNPTLCSRCCESLPAGGAEVDIAVLFADVRGSTALGASTPPALGDTVNVGARMQGHAAGGELLVRDGLGVEPAAQPSRRALQLRGHEQPVDVLVLTA